MRQGCSTEFKDLFVEDVNIETTGNGPVILHPLYICMCGGCTCVHMVVVKENANSTAGEDTPLHDSSRFMKCFFGGMVILYYAHSN